MPAGALSIKLRCTSWQQLATIYKRDLSLGTMFLKASNPPPIGTSVKIDLELPSASVIVLTGVIQQHVTDPKRGIGVELKLAPIPTSSIWMIESALAADAKARPGTNQAYVTGPVATISEGEDLAEAEASLINALLSEAESLRKLNPFLVLGVGYEATDADVRAAFGELTKRYHPDRFARYQSTELRQTAAEIFILIRDAYRKIGDEASRQTVLAQLGRAPAPRAVAAPRTVPPPVGPPPRKTPPVGIPTRPSGQQPATKHEETVPLVIRPGAPPTPLEPAIRPPAPSSSGRADHPLAAPTRPPQPDSERRPVLVQPPPVLTESVELSAVEQMLDDGRFDEALAAFKVMSKKFPQDRNLRAGIELCEGLRALAQRDRLEAAQRFESALEIDPSNERAARELADMRRQATNERKGLLSRLMGKKES
jgi:hypothetical protein